MFNKWKVSLAILSLGAMCGCGSKSSDSTSAAQPVAESQPVKRPIPPDSPFAKIKEGMGYQEVFATIGTPTSEDRYMTGKSFIPYHSFAGDNHRMTAHYKGVGTITFSQDSAFTSGMSVISIDYDPDEPGYARQ